MTKTRVLLWHWGRRGGGPRYTLELVKALRDLPGLQLELSLSRQSELIGEFREQGLPIHEMDTYSGRWSAVISLLRIPVVRRNFRRWLSERRFDVVVCTMSHLWDIAMLSAIKASGARFLFTLHDARPHPGENYLIRKWMLDREAQMADGIVTLTDSVRRTLCGEYGYPDERVWVIPLGVFPYFRAEAPRMYPRGRPTRILFFGRLLPYKGLPLLLEAFRVLEKRISVTLSIVGPGDFAPFRSSVQGSNNVTVDNRWIPEAEISAFFANADLVVAPYIEASQSGVIPAAYAAAVPAIVTPVGGLVEQVRQGNTGLVAEDVSPQAIARAIETLATDPTLYERCSAGALRYAREELSWSAVAKRFAEVIEQVRKLPRRGDS